MKYVLRGLGLVGSECTAAPAAAHFTEPTAEEPAIHEEELAPPAPTPQEEGPEHNPADAPANSTMAIRQSPATHHMLPDPCAANPVSEISSTSGSCPDMRRVDAATPPASLLVA